MLGTAVGIVFMLGAVLLLAAIVRFSIVSSIKTRGADARLRVPDVSGVEQICGFRLPEDLAAFYREADVVSMTDCELLDPASDPPALWPLSAFIPLTPIDVREWLIVTRAPGVPIATDGTKGTYYVSAEGTVRVSSPNGDGTDLLVAPTIAAFRAFKVAELEDLD